MSRFIFHPCAEPVEAFHPLTFACSVIVRPQVGRGDPFSSSCYHPVRWQPVASSLQAHLLFLPSSLICPLSFVV
jgi:hypothetical protein